MADFLDGLARHCEVRGLLTYDETAASGDTFIESMPSSPDTVIVFTIYGGGESDSLLGYDEPNVQLRVRGTKNPKISRQRCAAIRDELHGLGPVVLPDGTQLILSVALQAAPASMGVDSVGRHEHVCNFRMEIRNITTHRV
ncbi:minor capsid protein [Streptomyces flavidovirens]|uniref:minor capsid protein n=1 Tax=Streptomyces flavidovirens TaxID=67298 RepID=UPI000422E575|nr:minor capsid protein [Streptomyces flavidovirens]